MRSIKALALVLAPAALAGLVFAATTTAAAAAGQDSQSNTNTNANSNARRSRSRAASSNQNSSRRDEGDGREDQSTHGVQDSGPGRSAPARSRRSDESRYRFEVGVMPRHITNYFQAQDEFNSATTATPVRSVTVTTLSGSFEYDLARDDNSAVTAGLRVRRNLFKDLPGADSTDVDATIDFDYQPNRLRLGYFGTPRRLASIVAGRNIYAETHGFSAEYFRRIDRHWRARGGYQFARETFSEFTERNLSRHQLNGDIRYRVHPYFTPGVGFEYQRGNAGSENFSYTRPALVLLATSDIRGRAYLSFRYRFSDRDYTTGLATDSNFGREDKRHDVSFYSTVQLGRGFSLFGFVYHTDNNSNRLTRTFTSTESGLGLFYRFPN
ncbi:MAG TPA: hypothetical protein VF591_15510 [Pyrinomonadaceae bacterium]|jgi:hypothetical protein